MVTVRGYLADVVAGGCIESSTATVRQVVGELAQKLVTDFNRELGDNADGCLTATMCLTHTLPAVDMDSKLVDACPGENDTLIAFFTPPRNFISLRINDQFRNLKLEIQNLKLEIQDLKRRDVWAMKERELEKRRMATEKRQMATEKRQMATEKRQMAMELQDLRSEITGWQQSHSSLHLRIVLDLARRAVLQHFNIAYWKDLRDSFQSSNQLYEWLCSALPSAMAYRPTDKALELLCKPSAIRQAGTDIAHAAGKDVLALAISQYRGLGREELISLFEFAFGERFYTRS